LLKKKKKRNGEASWTESPARTPTRVTVAKLAPLKVVLRHSRAKQLFNQLALAHHIKWC